MAWLALVGTLPRLKVATLLSRPGTGASDTDVDIAVETVNGLGERGIGLASGDLLSTGSLTLPTPLHCGQTYVARFGDLATLAVSVSR